MGDNQRSHPSRGTRVVVFVGLAMAFAFGVGVFVGPALRGDGSSAPTRGSASAFDGGVRLALDGGVDLLPDAGLHIDLPPPPRP